MQHAPARPSSTGLLPMEGRVALAALAAGSVDILYAFGVNGAAGVPPERVLQYIASGLLGLSAFHGGWEAAALGAACHFGLMAAFATGVAWTTARVDLLRVHPLLTGGIAGLALYVVMNFLVVPLSRSPAVAPLPVDRIVLEFAVHVLVVGPLVCLIVLGWPRRRSAAQAID